jgi:hypothetical protein
MRRPRAYDESGDAEVLHALFYMSREGYAAADGDTASTAGATSLQNVRSASEIFLLGVLALSGQNCERHLWTPSQT